MPEIEADASSATSKLELLETQLEFAVKDGVEREALRGADNLRNLLRKQTFGAAGTPPTSASGQAERSIRKKKTGNNEFSVMGKGYLHLVESGTTPHTPDRSERLRIWADERGWELDEIVEHIKEHGTEPHPWKEPAFDSVVKLLPERVAAHVKRSVNIS